MADRVFPYRLKSVVSSNSLSGIIRAGVQFEHPTRRLMPRMNASGFLAGIESMPIGTKMLLVLLLPARLSRVTVRWRVVWQHNGIALITCFDDLADQGAPRQGCADLRMHRDRLAAKNNLAGFVAKDSKTTL